MDRGPEFGRSRIAFEAITASQPFGFESDDLLITNVLDRTRTPSAIRMSAIYDFVRRRGPGMSKASAKRLSLLGSQWAYQRSVVLGSE